MIFCHLTNSITNRIEYIFNVRCFQWFKNRWLIVDISLLRNNGIVKKNRTMFICFTIIFAYNISSSNQN